MEKVIINGKAFQIDVDKCKELGLIKSEDKLPKTWDEYFLAQRKNHTANHWVHQRVRYVAKTGTVQALGETLMNNMPYDTFVTQDETKAFEALGKLIQLRDAWVGDWKPDWSDASIKYVVIGNQADDAFHENRILAFPTSTMRDEFLNCFSELIEEAKMFL